MNEREEADARPEATPVHETLNRATTRPVLQMLARVIATDRRAAALASRRGDILLANGPARRLGFEGTALTQRPDWPDLCIRASRAGSAPLHWDHAGQSYEGEVVRLPLGSASGFLLRLSETDQEAALLRNRMRSAMLMRVAHDLRTPIQSLLDSAGALLDGNEAGDRAEAGANLRHCAELALDHISNVLAVIRGEQGIAGLQRDENFQIATELRNLVDLVRPTAARLGTDLTLAVDVPQSLSLRGPISFVRALFQNVIDNSVKHGGPRIQIRLEANPLQADLLGDEGGAELWRVRLQVRDEGGGLPPAQRARLNAAVGLPDGGPMAGGTTQGGEPEGRPSAGLNVLAHALQQLGGQLSVADRGPDGEAITQAGQGPIIGTILTATFSLRRAVEMPARPSPAEVGETPLTGRGILLVEDSPASRDWLSQLLESYGARIWAVGSAPEALALLSRPEIAQRVELVVTDVTLPRISGIQLARILGSAHRAPGAWSGRIVGLTAHVDAKIRAACQEAGMLRVLEKPIRPQHLLAALSDVLIDLPSTGEPEGDSGVAARLDGQTVLEGDLVRDLIDRLGIAPAQNFMGRALAEVGAVIESLRSDGIGPDTQRQLHAATGACGLTGLMLVERRLRRIEEAVAERQDGLAELIRDLDDALAQTRRLIDDLA